MHILRILKQCNPVSVLPQIPKFTLNVICSALSTSRRSSIGPCSRNSLPKGEKLCFLRQAIVLLFSGIFRTNSFDHSDYVFWGTGIGSENRLLTYPRRLFFKDLAAVPSLQDTSVAVCLLSMATLIRLKSIEIASLATIQMAASSGSSKDDGATKQGDKTMSAKGPATRDETSCGLKWKLCKGKSPSSNPLRKQPNTLPAFG